jgi:hypothetical protein
MVAERYRKYGIDSTLLNHLSIMCKTEMLFTLTYQSNILMKKLLSKSGFIFCGQIDAFDKGDAELFFVRKRAVK